jgi:hypothetical protein
LEKEKSQAYDNPFDEIGLNGEQFAEVALNSPIQWDNEQLDHLQTLFEDGKIDGQISRELLEEFLNPRQDKLLSAKVQERKIPRELMDPEEIAEEVAGAYQMPMDYSPPISYEVPTAHVNLDDWLKKK